MRWGAFPLPRIILWFLWLFGERCVRSISVAIQITLRCIFLYCNKYGAWYDFYGHFFWFFNWLSVIPRVKSMHVLLICLSFLWFFLVSIDASFVQKPCWCTHTHFGTSDNHSIMNVSITESTQDNRGLLTWHLHSFFLQPFLYLIFIRKIIF